MESYPQTTRTTVRRLPKRAVYDRAQIHAILDEGFLCHIGFVVEGQPYVIPTGYVRVGENLYFHGSAASRMLRQLDQGVQVCINVTIVDGFVLARSVFHHSMNYRSVVLFGTARLVADRAEKLEALHQFADHIAPGRWEEARQPNEQELKSTSVLQFTIEEASAKMRSGGPLDEKEDYDFPVWAGHVPIRARASDPVPDDRLLEGVAAFDVKRLTRFF